MKNDRWPPCVCVCVWDAHSDYNSDRKWTVPLNAVSTDGFLYLVCNLMWAGEFNCHQTQRLVCNPTLRLSLCPREFSIAWLVARIYHRWHSLRRMQPCASFMRCVAGAAVLYIHLVVLWKWRTVICQTPVYCIHSVVIVSGCLLQLSAWHQHLVDR